MMNLLSLLRLLVDYFFKQLSKVTYTIELTIIEIVNSTYKIISSSSQYKRIGKTIRSTSLNPTTEKNPFPIELIKILGKCLSNFSRIVCFMLYASIKLNIYLLYNILHKTATFKNIKYKRVLFFVSL